MAGPKKINELDDSVAITTATDFLAVRQDKTRRISIANLFAGIGPWLAALTGKTTPVDADVLPIADSAATNAYKKVALSDFASYIVTKLGPLVSAITAKATPVDADFFLLGDSAASNASKKTTMTQLAGYMAARIASGTLTINIADPAGGVLSTGLIGVDLEVPYNCTITGWSIYSTVSGSIVFDIWKDTYANFPPLVADTITASAKPTLSSSAKAQSSTLTGWTTTLTKGDILRFNIDSVTSVTSVTLVLQVTKT